MSVLNKCLPVVLLATGFWANAAWASGVPFPHATHKKNACPTAVERNAEKSKLVNPGAGEAMGEGQDMRKAGGDNKAKGNVATKGQDGMLLPAVKPGATAGQLPGAANVAHGSGGGGGAGKGLSVGEGVKADPPGGKSQ